MSDDNDEFTLYFNIENFSMAHQKMSEAIESPVTLAEVLDETKWCLHVYPRGNAEQYEGYVSCYLKRVDEDDGPKEIHVRFTYDVVANDATLQENRVVEHKAMKRGDTWGYGKFISREALFKVKQILLPGDTLRIKCHIMRVCPFDPSEQNIYIRNSFGSEKVKFIWAIKDFSKRKEESKTIKFASSRQNAYSITMTPVTNDTKFEIRVCDKTAKLPVVTICRMTVLDRDRQPTVLKKEDNHVFKELEEVWNFASFLARASMDLPNDVLTLECEIERSNGKMYEYMDGSQYGAIARVNQTTPPYANLVDDFNVLFENMRLTDVKLRIDEDTTVAHSWALCARSPVLKTMLKDRLPGDDGHIMVDIVDLDMPTLKRLVRYIYTEKTGELNLMSWLKLFAAGDIYQVSSLKEECSSRLLGLIGLQTACEIIVAAHAHSDPLLEEEAIEFVANFWEEVCLTEEWEAFLRQHREVAAQTRRRVREKRLRE